MSALQFATFGRPEVLHIVDIDVPYPGLDEDLPSSARQQEEPQLPGGPGCCSLAYGERLVERGVEVAPPGNDGVLDISVDGVTGDLITLAR